MNPYNKKIAVCFAGGTGGHFVFQIINSILFDSEIRIRSNGSCHMIHHLPDSLFVTDQYPIDKSENSFLQEQQYLQTITQNRVLGHIRQLNYLPHKCIYIDFTKDDVEKIIKKLKNKTTKATLSKHTYDLIKGEDWPEYGQELPDWVTQDIVDLTYNCINDWTWNLSADCFKIDFEKITDPCWLDDVAEWLQMSYNKEYVITKMKEYETLQR